MKPALALAVILALFALTAESIIAGLMIDPEWLLVGLGAGLAGCWIAREEFL